MSPTKERIAYNDAALDDVREHLTPPAANTEAADNAARKPWTEMTDQEQLESARSEGYRDAHIDAERDTLVLGRHESDKDSEAAADNFPAEMVGAYSSLGNRHTYIKDENGKSRSIKRADALEKAEEFTSTYKQSADSAESTTASEEEKSQADKQEAMQAKEETEARNLQSQADRDEKQEARSNKNDLTADSQESSVKKDEGSITPEDNGTTEDNLDVPQTEPTAVEGDDEDIVVEPRAEQRSLKDRLKAVKNGLLLLPARIMNRERREGPMTRRQKTIFAMGGVATVLAGAYVAHKFNVFGSNSGGGNSEVTQGMLDGTVDAPDVISTPDVISNVAETDFSAYKFPIHWAMEQVGSSGSPLDYLKELGERAAQDGHTVSWHPAQGGGEWIKVDGLSDTESVLRILNGYKI